MIVGTARVRLLIRGSRTLKDKRQVVRSVLERLKQQFNVSAAEVDSLDDVRLAVLGFAVTGAESAQVRGVIQAVVGALRTHPVAEFLGASQAVETWEPDARRGPGFSVDDEGKGL